MSEPNHVALAEMELLAKSSTIQTMIVGIGDQMRRRTILEQFADRYKDEPEINSVTITHVSKEISCEPVNH